MYKCTPLYMPSNLGETELFICISPGWGGRMPDPELWSLYEGDGKERHFERYRSSLFADNVKMAQKAATKLSRELEKECAHPIQSDRLYFLPLFDQVGYGLTVTPKKQHKRPVIRVKYYPDDPVRTWNCEIYTSSLVQLQEALFDHERNLLKKRLQVLDQQRAKT